MPSAAGPDPATIHLAASPGGHLDLLQAVAAGRGPRGATWVTVDGPRAEQLRESAGSRVIAVPWFERRAPLSVVRNVVASIALAVRHRPAVVVCAGAGGVAAYTLAARLLGARLIFVETMARVADASGTARVLGRLAEAVVVQWREGSRFHRRPVVCRPLLLTGIPTDRRPGIGSAAFVGTHSEPFDRLVGAVERAAAGGVLPGPVRLQAGVAQLASPHVEVEAWLPREEVIRRMAEAEIVVVHGGAGMISSALHAGRRPIVMCRLRRHGEHVDDHQLQLATKLAEVGLAVVVEDTITEADVERARAPIVVPPDLAALPAVDDVVAELVSRETGAGGPGPPR